MNAERIRRLADRIEVMPSPKTGELYKPDETEIFDMAVIINEPQKTHDCMTVGCIAGYAYVMAMEEDPQPQKLSIADKVTLAQTWLGLGDLDADQLFQLGDSTPVIPDYENVDARRAAATLRRLADTGEVEWFPTALPAQEAINRH